MDNKLFLLLKSEIGEIAASEDIRVITDEEKLKLFRLAKTHDLVHIISSALYKQNALGQDEVSQQYKKAHMLAIYRYERMKSTLEEIGRAFDSIGVSYVPLKGAVLRSYYPLGWMRTSCDIDILIHEGDLECAKDILVTKLGYKTDGKESYHDVSLYSPTGIHLELHFSLKENMNNIDGLLSKVWEYVYREDEASMRHCQTTEFFLFHHIAHMSYHFINGGCGVKPFMDMYIIRNKMTYDEAKVRQYCKQCDLEMFYDNVLHLTDVWFGGKTHNATTLKMEEYVLSGGVYGSIENKVTVAQQQKGGKVKYALSRIFISYDSLKRYYPVLKKHKWLFPFMQVRRWFRLIFCGGLRRGVNELKVNQNVEKEQADAMGEFIREVGL